MKFGENYLKIAILGWGSLIWDSTDLAYIGSWKNSGPMLPIEFSRISADKRLTLVIDKYSETRSSTWIIESRLTNLDLAINNLATREKTNKRNIGFFIKSNSYSSLLIYPDQADVLAEITRWIKETDFDAAIWTALKSNFEEKCMQKFSTDSARKYLQKLDIDSYSKAVEYICRSPESIQSELRKVIITQKP